MRTYSIIDPDKVRDKTQLTEAFKVLDKVAAKAHEISSKLFQQYESTSSATPLNGACLYNIQYTICNALSKLILYPTYMLVDTMALSFTYYNPKVGLLNAQLCNIRAYISILMAQIQLLLYTSTILRELHQHVAFVCQQEKNFNQIERQMLSTKLLNVKSATFVCNAVVYENVVVSKLVFTQVHE